MDRRYTDFTNMQYWNSRFQLKLVMLIIQFVMKHLIISIYANMVKKNQHEIKDQAT